MAHLASLTLDETHRHQTIYRRLMATGRLDGITNPIVSKALCEAIGEYMRDVKGPVTTGVQPSYMYNITDSDFGVVVDLFKDQLKEI